MSNKQGVVPCLLSSDCDKHIEWIKKVFGGKVNELIRTSDGKKVMHCTMAINDGVMSLGDGVCPCTPEPAEKQQQPAEGEVPRGAHCHLEVMDEARLNEIWKNAQGSGATTVVELGIQSWGDLYGMFKDPFGFEWAVEKPVGHTRKPGVVPYLRVPSDCEKYVELLKVVLGAQVEVLIHSEDKTWVQHCCIAVNGFSVYLSDFSPSELAQQVGGKPKSRQFICHLDVTDPQVIWQKAMDTGAQTVLELKVQSWGDLFGAFIDTFGFEWSVEKAKEATDPDVGVIPYILSPDGDKHVEWIKNVFGAEEGYTYRDQTTKKILHCSLKVNKGVIYLSHGSCTSDQEGSLLPAGSKSRGIVCHLNVKNPDAVWKKAMDNGAQKVVELKVQFWGDIYGSFYDPFGYEWAVCASATPKED